MLLVQPIKPRAIRLMPIQPTLRIITHHTMNSELVYPLTGPEPKELPAGY
ncbi:MAG: hypothetical protein OHK0012_18020 [Synechococcales cyanobacterium]